MVYTYVLNGGTSTVIGDPKNSLAEKTYTLPLKRRDVERDLMIALDELLRIKVETEECLKK